MFTNVVYAHHVVGGHLHLAIAGGVVGLGPQQKGDVGRQVGGAAQSLCGEAEAEHALGGGGRHSPALNGCKRFASFTRFTDIKTRRDWETQQDLIPKYLLTKSCWVILNEFLSSFTFSPHAHLETLFEAAVLALVAVVLVNGAVAGASALIRQVPAHRPLEEALASCKKKGVSCQKMSINS